MNPWAFTKDRPGNSRQIKGKTMLGTVLYGPRDIRCEEVAEPKIVAPTDAKAAPTEGKAPATEGKSQAA